MFDKFKAWFKKRDDLRVFVRTGLIRIDYQERYPVVWDQELETWLYPYKGKYELKYDEYTGERWLQFKDRATAIQCRLIFG